MTQQTCAPHIFGLHVGELSDSWRWEKKITVIPMSIKKLKPEEWLEKKETERNMQTLVFFILQKQTEKTDGIVLYRASVYPSITRVAALLQASKFINHKQHLGLFILWNPASLLIIIWLYGILLIYFVVYTSEFFYFFICLQIILRLLWAFIVRKKREEKYCT